MGRCSCRGRIIIVAVVVGIMGMVEGIMAVGGIRMVGEAEGIGSRGRSRRMWVRMVDREGMDAVEGGCMGVRGLRSASPCHALCLALRPSRASTRPTSFAYHLDIPSRCSPSSAPQHAFAPRLSRAATVSTLPSRIPPHIASIPYRNVLDFQHSNTLLIVADELCKNRGSPAASY